MKVLVPWSCRRADHIITISESSKRDLVEIYRVEPERITVTYPGAAENCKPMDAEKAKDRLRKAYGIEAPFYSYTWETSSPERIFRDCWRLLPS